MKKWIVAFLILAVVIFMGASTSSRVTSYQNLVVSAAGGETDLAVATGFLVGLPAPGTTALEPKDLLIRFGAGKDSYANTIEMVCFATTTPTQIDSTATMSLYGIAEGGSPERVGSAVWEFGTATRSSNVHWADICTPTDTHVGTFSASDSGNNRIVKLTMANSGYRHLYGLFHTVSGTPKNITVQMRVHSDR